MFTSCALTEAVTIWQRACTRPRTRAWVAAVTHEPGPEAAPAIFSPVQGRHVPPQEQASDDLEGGSAALGIQSELKSRVLHLSGETGGRGVTDQTCPECSRG